MRTSVAGGRATGLVSGLGINTGCLAWGMAAAVGVTRLLAGSQVAYDRVRIADAVTCVGWAAARYSDQRESEARVHRRPGQQAAELSRDRWAGEIMPFLDGWGPPRQRR